MGQHLRDEAYWARVKQRAAELESDGCTGVPDWCVECCWEHDIAWRTGATVDSEPQSLWQANNAFLSCITERKGWYHPRAYVRWAGVTIGAIVRTARRLAGLPSNPASDEGNEAP